MRLINGIFAVKLMQEARYEEAQVCLKPLVEWVSARKEEPAFLNPQSIDEIEENDKSRATLISVVQTLQTGPSCTKEQLEKASNKLAGILDELSPS
jgi:hypothetical protein